MLRMVAMLAVTLLAAVTTEAMPVSIGFSGMVHEVDDPAGVFTGVMLPTGRIDGSFTVDSDAGTLSFGDGTTGQRLPNGVGTINGTYRYGGGEAGNSPPAVVLFPNCFVGTVLGFQCAPGQGRDAYVVELPSLAVDGFVQSFAIVLATSGGLSNLGVLPPPLEGLETAEFVWRFSRGEQVASVVGTLDAIGVVSAPSSVALVVGGSLLLVARAKRARRRSPSRRPTASVPA